MKKFLKFQENFSAIEEKISEEQFQNFDKYRLRYNSPFKPRGPTPPNSREASPKAFSHTRYLHQRHSSVDSGNVFVLKIPFASASFINQSRNLQINHHIQKQKKYKGRKNNTSKRHRRSGSLELC